LSLLNPQLEAFIAISKYQSVHKAAESLFITQTAVTQRLKGLEQKLGIALFTRTRKGMRLTEEGKILLRYTQSAQMLEEDCLDQIQGKNNQSIIRLKLSAPSSLMQTRIIPCAVSILKKYPNLRLNFDVHDAENRHHILSSGKADLAILHKEHVTRELKESVLNPENYLLVGSAGFKKISLKDMVKTKPIIDFDEKDQATFNYLKKYNLFDDCQKERYFVNSIDNLIELLANGIGYSVLTEDIFNQYKNKKITVFNYSKNYEQAVSLCWYSRPNMPEYFKDLIDAIS
jgi:DNA-binding transcriptional LysR family regulator